MYILKITEDQAKIISKALDLYSRIFMGQFKEILDFQFGWKMELEDHEWCRKALQTVKRVATGLENNAYYGIFSEKISNKARAAYDIHQVIRNKLAWDNNPNGGITVNFDKPINTSAMPLPDIKKVE